MAVIITPQPPGTFLAGFGTALIISNLSFAIHSFTTFVELLLSSDVLTAIFGLWYVGALVICAILGFAVWGQRFLFPSFRRSRSQRRFVNSKYMHPHYSFHITDSTISYTDSAVSIPAPLRRPIVHHTYRKITGDDIAQAVILHSLPGSDRKVVKVDSNTVAKLGPGLDITEAESMRFIRNNTALPVPQVLNAYEEDGYGYILMEFVEGDSLEKIWPNLSSSERTVILTELKDYIRQMRQIVCPDGTPIGSVTGGPAIDRRQLSAVKGGPFRLEKDFNQWQLAQLFPETPLPRRESYASIHGTDHRIVFSHCDLAFHNIIVRDGHVVAIIDWEYSGWYPEHWDYCKTRSFLSGTDEFYRCCEEIFGGHYHMEYFMDESFTREVHHGGF
jgi:serine/threonine protein kinase